MRAFKLNIFFCIFLCYSCNLATDKNTRGITNEKVDATLVNMGIRNLPDLFFDHYYRYPINVEELYFFLENHYDFINDPNELWEVALSYLRQNKKEFNTLSQRGLFIIVWGNNYFSYNNNDICNIMTLHSPEFEFVNNRKRVNLFDDTGRNLREIIGTVKADSIATIFHKMKQELYHTVNAMNYYPEENNLVKFDRFRRVVLEYDIANGLQTFCAEEPLILSDNPFFEKLESICNDFCKQHNISRMIFNSLVFRIREKQDCE